MEPTALVSIEAELVHIMEALLNGFDPAEVPWSVVASIIMQELLSRSSIQNAPLRDQEFFELSLLDEVNQLGTRYCVRQAHAQWSDIDGQIMWDQEEVDHFWIINEAKKRYAERRLALSEKGFIFSDMEI